MLRSVALVGIVGSFLGGCFFDQIRQHDRPARFEAGLNTRHLGESHHVKGTIAPGGTAPRTSGEVPGEITEPLGDGASLAIRFTMKTLSNTYLGVEAEAGALEREGSNLAGGYGVAGARAGLGRFNVSAELAAGWRGIRETHWPVTDNRGVLEPRVRGELWLSDQITFGATAGADLAERGTWVAGFYLGVLSHSYDGPR